jgi:hypothetical protein
MDAREKREITTSSELNDYLAADWQGIQQVFRLERRISKKGGQQAGSRLWSDQLLASAGRSCRLGWLPATALAHRKPFTLAP